MGRLGRNLPYPNVYASVPEIGAEVFEWIAPTVSSVETAEAPEVGITADQKEFWIVFIHPEIGTKMGEW